VTTDGTHDAGARAADARPDPAAPDRTSAHTQIITDCNPTHIQPRLPLSTAHLTTSPCPAPFYHLADRANLTNSFFIRRTDICHPCGWRPPTVPTLTRAKGAR
jgi:hypothetical protein